MPDRDPLLTAEEVAELCRVSKRWIQAQAAAHEIPGAIRLGRLWRFRRTAVEQWLADKERESGFVPKTPSSILKPVASRSPFHERDVTEAYRRALGLNSDGSRPERKTKRPAQPAGRKPSGR